MEENLKGKSDERVRESGKQEVQYKEIDSMDSKGPGHIERAQDAIEINPEV